MNRAIRVLLIVGLAVACMGLATDTSDEELLEALLHQFVYGDIAEADGTLDARSDLISAGMLLVQLASYSYEFETTYPNLVGFAGSNPTTDEWIEVDSASRMLAEYIAAVGFVLRSHTSRVAGLTSRVDAIEAKPTPTGTACSCESLNNTVSDLISFANDLIDDINILYGDVDDILDRLRRAGIPY